MNPRKSQARTASSTSRSVKLLLRIESPARTLHFFIRSARRLVAIWPPSQLVRLAQQLRQLGDAHSNASRSRQTRPVPVVCSGARPAAFINHRKEFFRLLFLSKAGVVSRVLKRRSDASGTALHIVALVAVMVASCAWQPTPLDHRHALSEMADTAARTSARCQSSGAALGSPAYKKCRALLESK
jgi:hypothetical protein